MSGMRTVVVDKIASVTQACGLSHEIRITADIACEEGLVLVVEILNNKSLSTQQRQDDFESFLLGLTNMKRIADFTLGQYRRGASRAELAAFENGFQNYAVAVYQSYFAKYAGQTLRVTGSTANGPNDFVVNTVLVDPNDHSGQPPLEVGFRVLTDRGKPEVDDFSVAGIWISEGERSEFTAYLGQHGGSIPALIAEIHKRADFVRSGGAPTGQ